MSESRVILDTNIVSYLMKGGKLAAAYEPHLQSRLLGITFVTVGELYFGADLTGLMIGQTFILSARHTEAWSLLSFNVEMPALRYPAPTLRNSSDGAAQGASAHP